MPGPGFVTEIRTPNGSIWLVGLTGNGTAVYSDNTIRDEAGNVVNADAGLVAQAAERIDNRQPNGDPWPVKATDPRSASTTGGVAPGELPNTEPLFIAGVMTPEPVYDSAANGGWGTPVTTAGGRGAPSSYARRDDRWVWPDGRITDAQQTVLGYTNDIHAAARELAARGATPSITWTRSQVIAVPVGGTNDQNGSGGGTVVTAVPTTGGSYVMQQEETDSGFGVRPILVGDPNPFLDAVREDEQIPEKLDTLGNAGSGGGGTTGGGTITTTAAGGTGSGAAAPASFLTALTFGIPNWAWLAAAGVLLLKKGRR